MEHEKKIDSVEEFIKLVTEKNNASDFDETKIFWYRGESSVNWKTPLVPNSYRTLAKTFTNDIDDLFISENIKQTEQNVNAEFSRKAFPYIISKGINNSTINRYFLMQHYKINTRLLDWTENALLALFFALNDKSTFEDDAKVWILEPLELNSFTIQNLLNSKKSCKVIPTGYDSELPQDLINNRGKLQMNELVRRYLRMDFEIENIKNKTDVYYPFALYPPFLDKRMDAQKACFTIFGNKINGLFSIVKDDKHFIDSITISGGKGKTEMLKQLKYLGINFESIYPDLDGIGLSINDKYQHKFVDNRETLVHIIDSYNKKYKISNEKK